MRYSRNFGSHFPESALVIQEKKDVDDYVVSIVNQIESYVKDKNLTAANQVLEEHKDVLEESLINSAFINLLQEEIYNVGLLAISQQSTIISQKMPTTQITVGSYWLQDYE